MKFLRLIQSGYEDYSGPIGPYEFKNGVSEHQIPRVDRDRLAAAFEFVEYENEGDEHVPAGVAYRLIALSGVRADVVEPTVRQTEEEKLAEGKALTKTVAKDMSSRAILSRADLERIADKRGIAGLRDIGDSWGVKSREIMKLIGMIVEAQDFYLGSREAQTEERRQNEAEFEQAIVEQVREEQNLQAPEDEDEEPEAVPEEIKTPEDVEDEARMKAAASGDMSAAVSE